MREPLEQIASQLDALVQQLGAAQRRALARELARVLRASQQKRIAAQLNPDGTPFERRKPQLRAKVGRVRRTMFSKLRTARYLKTEATPDEAVVAFTGMVARIAGVHQLGLRDKVDRLRRIEVQYPARQLLGFSADDARTVEDLVLEHLAR
ncbi:phage virion morphogenesis protein [Roseateles flavus]|uniref:Phage virion morphogenesis protein n=1 Tax=Roseateles flavus TaxID=3149041 RepID=A0ABV0GG20_9BURK